MHVTKVDWKGILAVVLINMGGKWRGDVSFLPCSSGHWTLTPLKDRDVATSVPVPRL